MFQPFFQDYKNFFYGRISTFIQLFIVLIDKYEPVCISLKHVWKTLRISESLQGGLLRQA